MPEGVVSPAVLEAAPSVMGSPRITRSSGGRGATLEERLLAAWRSAQLEGVSECPVCRAAMRADGASARCGSCGSVVS